MVPPLVPIEAKTLRILAFGDSLTEGYTDYGTAFHPYGDSLRTQLQSLLSPETTVIVDIDGVSGDRVLRSFGGSFERRLHTALNNADTSYDIIILLGGTNDLAFTRNVEGVTTLFDQGLVPLYQYILDHSEARLLLMTVPERGTDHATSQLAREARANRERLNAMIEEWAAPQSDRVLVWDFARNVPHVGWKRGADNSECNWSFDALHMSVRGYDLVGQELAKVVYGLMSTAS